MKKIISLSLSAMVMLTMLSACSGGTGSTAGGDGAIALKFNFQNGMKYKYAIKNKQSISQEIMGKNMTIEQDMDMESSYAVAGAEGSNKKLTVTYDRLAMRSNNSNMKVEYDSDDTAHADPMFKSMGYMLHKPFSMTVNERGQILALEGFQQLMPDNVGASPLSDSSLRSMMQQSFYIYPDKPVKPGDTWTNTYTTSMGIMNLTNENSFKLTSVTNGIAHVEITSKITSRPGSDPRMAKMKMELAGTQTGGMDLDVATGFMVGGNMQQMIKGNVEMMSIKAPMQVTSTINITGTPEK